MTLRLLSFNVADAPIHKKREERMQAIAHAVRSLKPDVVFFQELVSARSSQLLQESLSEYSFITGESPRDMGGLAVASRLPFVGRHQFQKYARQAYAFPLSLSDKYLGKGMLSFSFRFGKKTIKGINTHLLSNYLGGRYGARALDEQLKELETKIKSVEGALVVSGDFNIHAGGEQYHRFIVETGLSDPGVRKTLVTYNPREILWPFNYIAKKIHKHVKIDYTFFRGFKENIRQRVVFHKKVFLGRKKRFLSDHFGLLSDVSL